MEIKIKTSQAKKKSHVNEVLIVNEFIISEEKVFPECANTSEGKMLCVLATQSIGDRFLSNTLHFQSYSFYYKWISKDIEAI